MYFLFIYIYQTFNNWYNQMCNFSKILLFYTTRQLGPLFWFCSHFVKPFSHSSTNFTYFLIDPWKLKNLLWSVNDNKAKTTIITRSGNLFEETLLLQLLLPTDESSLHHTVSSYLPARISHTLDLNHIQGVF